MIVGIAAASRFEDFGSSANCWLSTRHGTIWAFVAPFIVIIAINCVLFVLILRAVLKLKRGAFFRCLFFKTMEVLEIFEAVVIIFPLCIQE